MFYGLQSVDNPSLVLEIQGFHAFGEIDRQYDVDAAGGDLDLAGAPLGLGQRDDHQA